MDWPGVLEYRNQALVAVIDWKNQCPRIVEIQSWPKGRRPEGMTYRKQYEGIDFNNQSKLLRLDYFSNTL